MNGGLSGTEGRSSGTRPVTRLTIAAAAFALVVGLTLGLSSAAAGCARHPEASSPEAFLKQYNLAVNGQPTSLQVTVPADWRVPLGSYPEGLYWGIANELSKDAGLDLTALKGKTVEARVYAIDGGLSGEGDQSQFRYPSNVVILLEQGKVAGAWVNFNEAGPSHSVKLRRFIDITRLDFPKWAEREGFFADPGPNSDLVKLDPIEVIRAFFRAINDGDQLRANACLSPQEMLHSLYVNRPAGVLYNPDFGANNSYSSNILGGDLISWNYYYFDPIQGRVVDSFSQPPGDEVRVQAEVHIKWRDSQFNSPTGVETRFFILTKTAQGWKIEGIGTGP